MQHQILFLQNYFIPFNLYPWKPYPQYRNLSISISPPSSFPYLIYVSRSLWSYNISSQSPHCSSSRPSVLLMSSTFPLCSSHHLLKSCGSSSGNDSLKPYNSFHTRFFSNKFIVLSMWVPLFFFLPHCFIFFFQFFLLFIVFLQVY